MKPENGSEAVMLGVKWEYQNPPMWHPYPFEKINYDWWKHYAAYYWKAPFYVCALYLFVVVSLKAFMKNRSPYKAQKALILWNLALGVFSMLGFWRMTQELIGVWMRPNGFFRSVCSREGLNEPMAYWSVVFALSKYVELGDTIFIIIRKQPLIFLQWYHHCTALILAWQILPHAEPITRYFGGMNYGVHSIMYPYFALKAMKVYIPRNISKAITSLQLLQMLIAVSLNMYTQMVISSGEQCAREPESITWIWAIYGSYVIIFADFFYKTYYSKNKKL